MFGPAACENGLARPHHVRGVGRVSDHLQREIRLYARTQVEVTVMKQRPAAVSALLPAQIDGEFLLQHGVERLVEIMLEQHIFGRNRRIGFQFEHPMTVFVLTLEQGLRCCRNGAVKRRPVDGGCRRCGTQFLLHVWTWTFHDCMTKSAARAPERTALSIVAGRPVAVQSPASARLRHAVLTPGRLAFCDGVAAKVARRSRTICQGGISAGTFATLRTSCQIVLASSSFVCCINRSAPLMVADIRSSREKIHSAVPFRMPSMGSRPGGGTMRKWALTMARNSSGVRSSGMIERAA